MRFTAICLLFRRAFATSQKITPRAIQNHILASSPGTSRKPAHKHIDSTLRYRESCTQPCCLCAKLRPCLRSTMAGKAGVMARHHWVHTALRVAVLRALIHALWWTKHSTAGLQQHCAALRTRLPMEHCCIR